MDQKKYFAVAVTAFLFLSGCVKNTPPTHQNDVDRQANTALAEAASSVSQSLIELKATDQAAHPPQSISESPSPATYGMAAPTSIDWNGPVGPVVNRIAIITNYKVRTIGKKPNIPVMINISAHNQSVGAILRDVAYQCGDRAQIVVFPSTRVIELRYKQA